MTLSARNAYLALAFGILVLLVLGYGGLSFLLISREGWTARVGNGSLWGLFLETLPVVLGCVAGFFVVQRAFQKSVAPEAFFFALFLVTLAGESLLMAQAWINFSGFSAFFTALLTRVVWAFRFTGLFLLFCGSLFGFEFAFRRYGNLVMGSTAVGIVLAALLPLHSTTARNHLLYAVGDSAGTALVTTILSLVVAANYFIASGRPGASDRALFRAIAASFFLAAWALAIVSGPWGTLLAVPGVIFASAKAEQNPLAG